MAKRKPQATDPAAFLSFVYQYQRWQLYRRPDDRSEGYTLPSWWRVGVSKVFDNLLKSCRKRSIDPVRYVQWSLSPPQVLLDPPPEPNCLLEHRRMDAFKAQLKKDLDMLSATMTKDDRNARGIYELELSFDPDPVNAAVAVCTNQQVSPLHRYVLAREYKWKELAVVASKIEWRALMQFSYFPPEYAKLYGKRLPSDFAARAARAYADHVIAEEEATK